MYGIPRIVPPDPACLPLARDHAGWFYGPDKKLPGLLATGLEWREPAEGEDKVDDVMDRRAAERWASPPGRPF